MHVNSDRDIMSGLDDQQREAASHVDGSAIIVAGAGSGKTTVLVRRTAHLISIGVKPQSILLLTFTRAAAKSILGRAKSFAPACDDVFGGTFHSVAVRILRQYHMVFGLPEKFTILEVGDVDDVLKSIMGEYDEEEKTIRASVIAKIISFSVNSRSSIPNTVYDRFPKYINDIDFIDKISSDYTSYKKSRHILDFDDLLLFWSAMINHAKGGEIMRSMFSHVMVDEHQDSNPLQLEIIDGLTKLIRNVVVVGDPAQSIYGFRGATPDAMFSFEKHDPRPHVYLIERNYRSTPEIVDSAFEIDHSMTHRFDRRLIGSKPSIDEKPSIVTVRTHDVEADWIASQIKKYRDEGIDLSRQAVLVRSMRMARHVEMALTSNNIDYVFLGGVKIHEAAHIREILSPLRIFSNILDEPAWVKFLSMMKGIGLKTAKSIASEMISMGSLEHAVEKIRDISLKKKGLIPAVLVLSSIRDNDDPSNALSVIKEKMTILLSDRWGDEWDWRSRDIDSIIDLAHSYTSIDEFIQTLTIDVSLDKKNGRGISLDASSVMTVATVHSAKGLEWDVVYFPSFIDGHLPSRFVETNNDFEEEKRLFYVVATRAKSHLYYVKPQMIFSGGSMIVAERSPFERIISGSVNKIHIKDDIDKKSVSPDFLIDVR